MRFFKISVILLGFALSVQNVISQDFDIYPRLKDDNVKMPDLYENTFFDEYQILSRNVRMMDMAYAVFVPGYVHFKAKDKITGYSLLGMRMLAYGSLGYISYRLNQDKYSFSDVWQGTTNYKNTKTLLETSLTLIAATYLFDWIHGKYRLEKKQELIRYKYSIKLKMDHLAANPQTSVFPKSIGLSLSIGF